ncbi:MAG: hypothetical protein WCK11_04805 [Candidatus Falkowbacteria bacterium]
MSRITVSGHVRQFYQEDLRRFTKHLNCEAEIFFDDEVFDGVVGFRVILNVLQVDLAELKKILDEWKIMVAIH